MNAPTRRYPRWLVAALVVLGTGNRLTADAAATNAAPSAPADFAGPAVFTGRIYARVAEPKDLLFTFRRTITRSNSTVRVLREFNRPDGSLAARERVLYENGRLVSCDLEEPAVGSHGGASIGPHPRNRNEQIISFEFFDGSPGGKKSSTEPLQRNTLNNDMIGVFIGAHWAELMRGGAINFRFTAVARAETVGFTLTKETDTVWRGKPATLIKMEATHWMVGQFVNPLHFTVETAEPHRVLQYVGRTTPSVQRNGKWEDLEALTVFDWE